jgi:hypothetical protein
MMRRETAYKLAGRHHDQRGVVVAGLDKVREIRFRPLPPGQVDRALRSLRQLEGLTVECGSRPLSVVVRYSILEYSLEVLELALSDAGFHLDQSLFVKLRRAIVNFCEETQRHNLLSPERLVKQSNEVYIKAYDHHPHGDHDDTPPELREYK